jgi:hypothetical protein
MPLPTVRELDSGGSSLSDSGQSCAPPLRGPKKSVRFAADPEDAHEKASHSPDLVACPSSSGNDDGSTSGAAMPAGSGDNSHAAGGKAHPDISAADTSPDGGYDAVDAKGHGVLPSWRLHFKMPVVAWWVAPGSV